MEIKSGFIPGSSDTAAWRVRRRFRMHKGGHPQLVLIQYARGQPMREFEGLAVHCYRRLFGTDTSSPF